MRYVLVDQVRNSYLFSKEFDTKEEAVRKASIEWAKMTEHDKRRRESFYVLESINPDEEAENHFDGTPVWEAKTSKDSLGTTVF